jgi:type IV pilus assembly protein PilX
MKHLPLTDSRLMPRRPPRPPRRRPCGERGLALVCALMLMLGALILGVSIARTAFASMDAARMARERIVARAAAEAALADAEADIEGGASPSSARAAWFAGGGAGGGIGDGSGSSGSGSSGSDGLADGCGQGSQDLGLCLPAAPPSPPLWQAIDLAGEDGAPVVPYGAYTGATLATGGGILPARLPAYLIEKLEPAGAGPPAHHLYRITAIGFGTRPAIRVVLQAVYRKPAAPAAAPAGSAGSAGPGDPPAPGGAGAAGAAGAAAGTAPPAGAAAPVGRIGWREIANWPELHARAIQ